MKRLRIILFVSIINLIVLNMNHYAGIFDNLSVFNIGNEIKDKSESKIDKELYDKLSDEEKEAFESLDNLYNALKNLNYNELSKIVQFDNKKSVSAFKNNIDSYEGAEALLKMIFSDVKYEVYDSSVEGDTIVLKSKIKMIDTNKMALKIAPKFIASNFGKIVTGNISLDKNIIEDIITLMSKEIKDNGFEEMELDVSFRFKKVDDIYKLVNASELVTSIEDRVLSGYKKIINR